MRIKYKLVSEYQTGGVLELPFMTYTAPPSVDLGTSATASSDSSSSKSLADKDVLELLSKVDGLPSDISVITDKLKGFYSDAGFGVGALNSSSIASKYLQTVSQIQIANFNKKEYDNAYDQVSKNGGLDEWAITDRGLYVCTTQEGDDFKFLTAAQLKEDMDKEDGGKYIPLTNSELLYYRANDTSLAFQNKLLSVVQNGIGMETVTQLIQNALSSLGSAESSDEGYASGRQGKLIQGYQAFQEAVKNAQLTGNYSNNTRDLYKYKYLTKSQAEAAEEAFSYIYNMLPTNAKALLKAKSDLTEDGAKKLVQTLVASKLESKADFSIDLVGGPTSKSLKDSTNDTSLKDTQLVEMVKGIGGVKQTMTVDKGNGIQMSVVGRKYNLPTDANGNPVSGDMSLADMLSQTGIQHIVSNMQSITFGDQKVPVEALSGITYNSTGVLRANLPINSDGSIDFSVMEKYEQAEAELDALGHEPSGEERRKAFEAAGITDLLNADGSVKADRFGAFLVTEGYTTDALSGVTASDYVHEINKWKSKNEAALIKKSLSTKDDMGNKNIVRVDTKSVWPGDWLSKWYDHIYKAAIYIPITNNTLIAARGDKQFLDYDSEALSLEKKYQDSDKILGLQNTSASVLGLNS